MRRDRRRKISAVRRAALLVELYLQERVAPALTELGWSLNLWGTRYDNSLDCPACTDGFTR